MKRFLKYTLLSNFLRSNITICNARGFTHNFTDSDEETNKKGSRTVEESNSRLLVKILSNKNEEIRVQMLKSFIKINPESRWKAIPINYLLKSKIKKYETQINRKEHKGPEKPSKCGCTLTPKNDSEKTDSSKPKLFRPKREEPGKVIWGFIPIEWTTFFIPVTGYSGFYTLLFTYGTYLFSKEIYVCDHEYYNGISIIIMCIYAVKKKGKDVARYLDKEIDKYEKHLNNRKDQMKQNLLDYVDTETKAQYCIEGQLSLIQAKRENVHLQREVEYRRRQMDVYKTVNRILNYQVGVEEVRKKIQQKNLIQWVTKEVEKGLTPELKENYMKLCIADIEKMLKSNKGEQEKK